MIEIIRHAIVAAQWALMPISVPLLYFPTHWYYCPHNAVTESPIVHAALRPASAAGAVAMPYEFVESATEGMVDECW